MLTKSGGGQPFKNFLYLLREKGGGVTTHFLKITQFEKKKEWANFGTKSTHLGKKLRSALISSILTQ